MISNLKVEKRKSDERSNIYKVLSFFFKTVETFSIIATTTISDTLSVIGLERVVIKIQLELLVVQQKFEKKLYAAFMDKDIKEKKCYERAIKTPNAFDKKCGKCL